MRFIKKNPIGIICCVIIAGISTFLASLNIGNFSIEAKQGKYNNTNKSKA